jgi:hypothetical protein
MTSNEAKQDSLGKRESDALEDSVSRNPSAEESQNEAQPKLETVVG